MKTLTLTLIACLYSATAFSSPESCLAEQIKYNRAVDFIIYKKEHAVKEALLAGDESGRQEALRQLNDFMYGQPAIERSKKEDYFNRGCK